MSKGPQLTQRKLDKLRDALYIVLECDQVLHGSGPAFGMLESDGLRACDYLQNILEGRSWDDNGDGRGPLTRQPVGGYAAGPKKVSDLEPPPRPDTKGWRGGPVNPRPPSNIPPIP